MKIHDISLPIFPGMVVWPERSDVSVRHILDQEQGDHATDSEVSFGVHTGTHVDAPVHFVRGGTGVDLLALEALYGPALVCHDFEADALTAEVFEKLHVPSGVERLLVRTRNSDLWANYARKFAPDYVAVTADGARWLAEHKIKVIGVDYLSVASFTDLFTPHDILLRAGVIPVEGLNLSGIAAGDYTFCCLPLKLVGADGAPARAILIENE
jgi:arylformamidase